jgi:hypothetical protein
MGRKRLQETLCITAKQYLVAQTKRVELVCSVHQIVRTRKFYLKKNP